VIGLGLSLFALIGGLCTLELGPVKDRFEAADVSGAAWFLMAVATFFGLLWLAEIVPDLSQGAPSTSAGAWNVPTNPVHVLDLAFFLPAVFVTGGLLLRRQPLGYATAPGHLTWLALTCVPIVLRRVLRQLPPRLVLSRVS